MNSDVTKSAQVSAVIILLVIPCLSAIGADWKTFASRGGWSISYPADWRIGSCQSCTDPTAEDVFVDFFPPSLKTADGWVMVSPLARRPSDISVDAWLAKVSREANLNPHVHEAESKVNGLSALRVRYRSPQGEMEEIYVVSGSRTFSVSFSADPGSPGTSLETLPNYPIYSKMFRSFRVKR